MEQFPNFNLEDKVKNFGGVMIGSGGRGFVSLMLGDNLSRGRFVFWLGAFRKDCLGHIGL